MVNFNNQFDENNSHGLGLRLWTMQEDGTKLVKRLMGDIPSANAENPHQKQQNSTLIGFHHSLFTALKPCLVSLQYKFLILKSWELINEVSVVATLLLAH